MTTPPPSYQTMNTSVMMQPQAQVVMQPQAQVLIQPQAQVVMQPQAQVLMQPQAQVVMQPQAQVVMQPQAQAVMQPQAQVVMQPQAQAVMQPQPQQIYISSKSRALKGIAIAEVVLGSMCVILGVVLISDGKSYRYSDFRPRILGQEIWGSVWVIVAGGFGIAAGGKKATPYAINCHIGFTVVGAIFSAALVILELSIIIPWGPLSEVAMTVIVAASISFLLLIASSYLACGLSPKGCCTGCCEQGYTIPNHQIIYVATTPNQQPQTFQNLQSGQTQPGYIIQAVPAHGITPQPAMPVVFQQVPQIPSSSTTTTTLTRAIDQLDSSDVQRKQTEAFNALQSPAEGDLFHPPVYSP
ncbi:unnamed protein product [Clavelina lepadiformis]|uniref:Uncharacterized protein n=1 Tax=Clavelina lepadiformis TaxID=159417 RepID=A0ABP0FJP2_CLALP